METEKKPSLLESSQTLTMIILFGVVFATGALFYYNWYSDLDSRNEKLKSAYYIGKGRIIEVTPIQLMSMHYDGNKILDIGQSVTYEFLINSELKKSTERIDKTNLKTEFWNELMQLKIGDSVKIAKDENGEPMILFSSENLTSNK
jgi:hypothetical protein